MSGWNASRSTWDSEGGVSDSTPGLPNPGDPSRAGSGRHAYGQPGQHRQPGQPDQPSLPDYDPQDPWPQDHGDWPQDPWPQEQGDWPQDPGDGGGFGTGGYQNGAGGQHGHGTHAFPGFPPADPSGDYGQQGQQFEQRENAQPGRAGRHAAGRGGSDADYVARMDPALQDFFSSPPARSGFAAGPDPAAAPGWSSAQTPQAPQPGYRGQHGYPGEASQLPEASQAFRSFQVDDQQLAPRRDGQPRQPTGPQQRPDQFRPDQFRPDQFQPDQFQPDRAQPDRAPWASRPSQPPSAPPWATQPGQPGQPGQPRQAEPWDRPAPRPGSRPASHADRGTGDSERGGRGKMLIALAVVVVLAVAAAAYVLLGKHGSTPTTSTPPATAPARTTPSASHPASASASASPTQAATGTVYTLSTPATAGGYPKLATAPSSVTSAATATAQSVREQAVTAGGKVTSQVSGYYQLSSGQVMSFAGYEGTFDPAKVLASLGQVGPGAQTYPAGPDGGDLACIPSAGTPGGTVCVWVTMTTLGVTEFFAPNGAPENVTNQPKAAQDTVKFRADAEAAKS